MKRPRTLLATLASAAVISGLAAPAMASTTLDGATTVADWEMNEAAGATTMVDSSANHLDGTIIPSDELQTGVQFDVDTLGYHWVRRPPNLPPAVPERIVQVPDNNLLDVPDPSVTYTLEIRYRTKENFGNIVQKGQSASRGGQIKVQQPQGRPSCLFKGSLGRVTARVKAPLNDNLFHTLTCVRTPTQVRVYVDGNTVPDQIKNGSTGAINNLIPYTIGGKINCDQIVTTCDYFSGDIDYVKVTTTP